MHVTGFGMDEYTSDGTCYDTSDGSASSASEELISQDIFLADETETNNNILCLRCGRCVNLLSPAATGAHVLAVRHILSSAT